MLVRLICFLSVFTLLTTSFTEVVASINLKTSKHEVSSEQNFKVLSNKVSFERTHCEDCKDDGCPETKDCCQSFCSCSSSFFISSKNEVSCASSPLISKIEWYLYSNYRSPFIDPALKPPLFS